MSRSRSRAAVWWVLGAAVAVGAWQGLNRLVSADPLARFREPEGAKEAVQMTDFDWSAYDKGRLVAKARVGRLEAGRDRDEVRLFAVTDGRYYAANDREFGFQAKSAVYVDPTGTLLGQDGARVWDERMDVSAPAFRYEAKPNRLLVPGKVVGKLHGGDVKADSLSYELGSGLLTLGAVVWQGQVEGQESRRRPWRFETPPDSKSTVRGGISTFEKVRATDGEVIVKAERAVYDRDKDVLTATGRVQYFGTDANLTCDQVVVYRKERRAVLTGNVDMLIKAENDRKLEEIEIPPLIPIVPEELKQGRPPAPPPERPSADQERRVRDGETIRDYPTTVTAQRIEYWYGKGQRRALVSGNPQARQQLAMDEWRVVWAERGDWDGERDLLKLFSSGADKPVRMRNSLGDDYRAKEVTVSTKEGDDTVDAVGLTADLTVDEDELPNRGSGSGGATTGGG